MTNVRATLSPEGEAAPSTARESGGSQAGAALIEVHSTPPIWEQPAVIGTGVSALLAFIGVLIITITHHRLHKQRLIFEERIATQKSAFDIRLAERKFELDRDLGDWKRRSDFAEIALAEFYEVRSRLEAVRSPASYASDNEDRIGRDQEPEDLRAARDSYYPVIRRFRENIDFFNSFYARRYRARALFGSEIDRAYRNVWAALSQVSVAAGMLMSPGVVHEGAHNREHNERMRERIWAGLAEPDAVAGEMDGAVEIAEQSFQPVITGMPQAVQN